MIKKQKIRLSLSNDILRTGNKIYKQTRAPINQNIFIDQGMERLEILSRITLMSKGSPEIARYAGMRIRAQTNTSIISFNIFLMCFFRSNCLLNRRYPFTKKNKGTHVDNMVLPK
jgi:hypothetical protein